MGCAKVMFMVDMDSTQSEYNKQVLSNTQNITSMRANYVRYHPQTSYKSLAPNEPSSSHPAWQLKPPSDAALG
jgi:hypothetical protein